LAIVVIFVTLDGVVVTFVTLVGGVTLAGGIAFVILVAFEIFETFLGGTIVILVGGGRVVVLVPFN